MARKVKRKGGRRRRKKLPPRLERFKSAAKYCSSHKHMYKGGFRGCMSAVLGK